MPPNEVGRNTQHIREGDGGSEGKVGEVLMDLNHEMSKFTHGEAGGIRRFPHRWQRTVDALEDYFDSL